MYPDLTPLQTSPLVGERLKTQYSSDKTNQNCYQDGNVETLHGMSLHVWNCYQQSLTEPYWLKTLIFRLLLPLLVGEGGWVGEVRRTHVKLCISCTILD